MAVRNRVLAACRAAALVLVLGVAPLAHAQMLPSGLPDADKQQIKQYTLNDDVFGRLAAATREARATGIPPQAAPDPGKVHNLDELAAQAMASDPRIPVLVKKYGFTPREFMLANIALMNAVMAVQARNNAALSSNLNQVWINADNIRYVEGHQSEVQSLMSGQ